MADVERIYADQLVTITSDCEVCGNPVAKHSWADMDPNGFIEYCSFKAFDERMQKANG